MSTPTEEEQLEAEFEGAEPPSNQAISPKEEAVLNHIISGLSRSAAVEAVGYNFKNPSKGCGAILRRPAVAARFRELQEAARERARISQDDVVEGFREAINDAKMTSDPQAQIAGWREIAKLLGMYAPKAIKVKISKTEERAKKELSAMTEKELLEIAGSDSVIEGEFSILENNE